MKPERILVPIDTAKCRPEVFSRVNAFAGRPGVTVILLHVVHLNIVAPENRIYEDLAQTARWHLERLAREYLHPGVALVFHVRAGKPTEEIVAEAKAEDVDLMIVPASGGSAENPHHRSVWKRLLGRVFPGVGEKLARVSPCPLLVVHAATCFNCQERWGHRVSDIRAALQYLEVNAAKRRPSTMTAEDSLPEKDRPRRIAA